MRRQVGLEFGLDLLSESQRELSFGRLSALRLAAWSNFITDKPSLSNGL